MAIVSDEGMEKTYPESLPQRLKPQPLRLSIRNTRPYTHTTSIYKNIQNKWKKSILDLKLPVKDTGVFIRWGDINYIFDKFSKINWHKTLNFYGRKPK